jgi:hypothetical protein
VLDYVLPPNNFLFQRGHVRFVLAYLIPVHFLPFFFLSFTLYVVASLSDALSYNPKGRGFDSSWCTGILYWYNPSGSTETLGFNSASNRNECQEYFLGSKGGRCVGLTTLPPSCDDCFEILEPQRPGTLRACPGL